MAAVTPPLGVSRSAGASFAELLAERDVLVSDGGLATHLETLGFELSGELWSARALLAAPELVLQVHHDYLAAGADIVTTASYQATLPGLVRAGMVERRARALLRSSVELARDAVGSTARGNPPGRALVAASVGPFGAYLADGSEYRGDYVIDSDQLRWFHRPRLVELAAAGPDLFAFETLPSAAEAKELLVLAGQVRLGGWFSFVFRDGEHLADGSDIDELEPLFDHALVDAIGANCVSPKLVPDILRALRRRTDKPLIVYPNSGEEYRAGGWRGRGYDWIAEAPAWRALGASVIGGCCRTGPEQIRRLAALLRDGASATPAPGR